MAPDRRRSDRSPAWVEAVCHIGGAARRTRLTEVCNDGCRAELAFEGAIPGERVLLRLTDLLVLPATVVWVHEGECGLEFSNPMFGAMLGQFVLHYGKPQRMQ